MHELVSRLVTNVNLPLMLDSTEWEKMEAGLKVAGGKCILNSTNYEDGDESFFKVLELAKNMALAWWWAPSTRRAWPARLSANSPLPNGPTGTPWSMEYRPMRSSMTPWLCPSPQASRKIGAMPSPRWKPSA
jgi:hypothetical protein